MSELITKIIFKGEPLSPINQYRVKALFSKRLKKWIAILYIPNQFKKYQKAFKDHAVGIIELTKPWEGPVKVIVNYYFSSKRRKDIKNCGKLEMDALNGIVYIDDEQIYRTEEEKFYDKHNPRIELTFYKHTNNGFL